MNLLVGTGERFNVWIIVNLLSYDFCSMLTLCLSQAKQLYSNEGFKEVDVSYKSFFGFFGKQILYHMYRPIHHLKTMDNELAEKEEKTEN